MLRASVCVALTAVLVFGSAMPQAADIGTEIDLTAFDAMVSKPTAGGDAFPLQEVADRTGTAARRLYLSGMIGPSFANVTSTTDDTISGNESLFAAGIAFGMAFERPNGRLRIEAEGMGRTVYVASCPEPSPCSTVLTNNWSAMANMWRDLMLTERFGVYGGGGIGAGGYLLGERFGDVTLYEPAATSFAWQAGGGLLWQMSDRVTFDVGYRYFQIDSMSHEELSPTLFAASELMFTLRLYEPFRRWRR